RFERRPGPRLGQWLQQLLTRRHRHVVAIALANKMARVAWTVHAQGGVFNVRYMTEAGGARPISPARFDADCDDGAPVGPAPSDPVVSIGGRNAVRPMRRRCADHHHGSTTLALSPRSRIYGCSRDHAACHMG